MNTILDLPVFPQVKVVLESVLSWNPQSPYLIERRGYDPEKRAQPWRCTNGYKSFEGMLTVRKLEEHLISSGSARQRFPTWYGELSDDLKNGAFCRKQVLAEVVFDGR